MNGKLIFTDNMEYMKTLPDKCFDLALVDPEQGRKEHGGKNRGTVVTQKNGKKSFIAGGDYKKREWDNEPASPEYFKELFRVSKHQIIWGANFYHENFGPGRIIWDKCNEGSDQSNCEIAYNSLTQRVDLFRYMWRGMMQGKSIKEGHVQQGNKKLNQQRIHPTEKPVALYTWTLQKYAQKDWTILDTHGGSMSIAMALEDLGFKDYVILENDKGHYDDAVARFNRWMLQRSTNPKMPFAIC